MATGRTEEQVACEAVDLASERLASPIESTLRDLPRAAHVGFYLVDEGRWSRDGKIKAPDFDMVGSREKLVALIEEKGLERDLRELVADVWDEIEEASEVKRKRRYD